MAKRATPPRRGWVLAGIGVRTVSGVGTAAAAGAVVAAAAAAAPVVGAAGAVGLAGAGVGAGGAGAVVGTACDATPQAVSRAIPAPDAMSRSAVRRGRFARSTLVPTLPGCSSRIIYDRV